MATHTSAAVVPNSRTPYSVVIHVANDGGADDPVFSYTRAALLAALLPGPLKELFARTADWSDFNFAGAGVKGDFVRINMIDGGLGAVAAFLQPPNVSCIVQFAADALNLSTTHNPGEGYVACGILIELRHVHSNER